MLVGVPKEIKNHEYRVGLVPASVRELVHHGHKVMVETGVGEGIGCTDDDYHAAGAEIVGAAADVFAKAEMVVKVKEPQPAEVARLREGQILFTRSEEHTSELQSLMRISYAVFCLKKKTKKEHKEKETI